MNTGVLTVRSHFGASETMARLEAAINAAGMIVFARLDHSAAAAAAHLILGFTTLVIFGNAKIGTALMQANQTSGLDLPLKALVYHDATDLVWVVTNDLDWLAERHGLGPGLAPTVAAMTTALKGIIAHATGSALP